ncbi:putative ribonuclease H-like domain-containing protein, partial [Tanacetum coccineum]
MSVLVTAEEKTNKKNNVKARSLLLMAPPNEHQLTSRQYNDAKTMFAAIKIQFGGLSRKIHEMILEAMDFEVAALYVVMRATKCTKEQSRVSLEIKKPTRKESGTMKTLLQGNVGLRWFRYLTGVRWQKKEQGKPQQDDTGFIGSGCSRHNTGNIAFLFFISDSKNFIGGFVTFGGGAHGGRISEHVPKESLTCLVAKATSDESMLWHRRLGHINFKNINKLVKDNLNKRFLEKGIRREYSVARTPQQRMIRVLMSVHYSKEEISQVALSMPIWKDVITLIHFKNVDKSKDDSSPKEVNTARQHVNTASPEVNIGSFKLNTVDPSVCTASLNDTDSPKDMFKMGASHTLEATHVEFFSDEDEPEVDLEKPLVKDGDADDVDVHLYRSMIGSLIYLTTSRPDIMFVISLTKVLMMLEVGDEAVHKEFGDSMERAVTIASSLEAGRDNCHIHYALTASPTIYTSLIEQFWQTAALCTIDDGVMGITATIDRKGPQSTCKPPITPTEEAAPMPHESPLHSVYSLRRDEGSMQQHELMDLVTKLTDRIGFLEKIPLILISIKPQQAMEYDFDATASILVTTAGLEISTANAAVTTTSASISTVSPPRVSTAKDISGAKTLVYIRRSASKAKDIEKPYAEIKPPKKIKKRVQVQMSIDEELAKKLDEREEVTAKEAHDIDWRTFCEWDQIQSFVPMDSEKEKGSEKKTEGRLKRAGQYVIEEPAKRQKTAEALESVQEQPSEEPKSRDELSQNNYNNDGLLFLKKSKAITLRYWFVIHMMVEKKYPLLQDTLSKMLSRRLEVDHQSEIGYELI